MAIGYEVVTLILSPHVMLGWVYCTLAFWPLCFISLANTSVPRSTYVPSSCELGLKAFLRRSRLHVDPTGTLLALDWYCSAFEVTADLNALVLESMSRWMIANHWDLVQQRENHQTSPSISWEPRETQNEQKQSKKTHFQHLTPPFPQTPCLFTGFSCLFLVFFCKMWGSSEAELGMLFDEMCVRRGLQRRLCRNWGRWDLILQLEREDNTYLDPLKGGFWRFWVKKNTLQKENPWRVRLDVYFFSRS